MTTHPGGGRTRRLVHRVRDHHKRARITCGSDLSRIIRGVSLNTRKAMPKRIVRNDGTIDHGELGPDHPTWMWSDCKHCQRIARLSAGLHEFGYRDLTIAQTRDAYHIAMNRKPDASDGIIAMLIRSQLIEAGLVSDKEQNES